MNEKSPINENNFERINKDFRSIKFACVSCGSREIEIISVEPHVNGKVQGLHESSSPDNDIELTFYVTGLLFCINCKHRFYVKILDQGIRNTDVYFDNTLG